VAFPVLAKRKILIRSSRGEHADAKSHPEGLTGSAV
jgi:hypothetical protein